MDLHVSLPWELEEDILSRLPPQSLVRFRAVSKRWNSLITDKSFINKHLSLSRPHFIFLSISKVYSIDIIDQRIKLRKLHSSFSNLNLQNRGITTCDDLLFCKYTPFHSKNETALWNPWLRQANLIKLPLGKGFNVVGIGYDNSRPQKVHKILLHYPNPQEVAIYECASHVLRFIDTPYVVPIPEIDNQPHVSLYGNLYWIAFNLQTSKYFIQCFDFSKEIFKPVCPPIFLQDNSSFDELLLAVCKGDRLSLLKQSYLTRKIEIWVMTNKIDDSEEVVWVNLMTLTATNLPYLFDKAYGVSYFIYDETLFVCCGDDVNRHPCIYIAKGDMCNKIQIRYGHGGWFSHCASVPNLISVPLEFHI